MKILLLSIKQEESDCLAKALAHYGHEVDARTIMPRGKTFPQRYANLINQAVKEKSQFIILDGSYFDMKMALAAHYIKHMRLILYLKGYIPAEYKEYPPSLWKNSVRQLEIKLLLSSSVHIVYVSNWLKEQYMVNPELSVVRKKPSSVIYLGPDPFFYPQNTRANPNYEAEKTLCYAGVFTYFDKARGVLLLLDAYSQVLQAFPQIRLYICGDGKYKPMLEEKAKELNLGDRVVFKGKVGQEELREYYRRSYAFVYSSFLDGCPKTVLNAQTCGLPAIVTRSSGAAELISDGKSGIVCQPNVKDLTEAILHLLRNPEVRRCMATQAVEHMSRNMIWEAAGASFHKIITSL